MKAKILFVVFALGLAYNTRAQFDTVPEFDPHYLYQYPEDSLMPYIDTIYCGRYLWHACNGGIYNFALVPPKESAAVFYHDYIIESLILFSFRVSYHFPFKVLRNNSFSLQLLIIPLYIVKLLP